ncbi:retrovirus-related Pol polyprotein from transposon opus isoform X6 [Bactrocera dorsalis]|uniref:Retrovirus-related Pol polyprotein from transposon opus isoform X6 n=1 Tax=Bactrocera dorsalis TaxID=27457 RepID=A0ABM3IYE8_BACDO|nr:retrovirus-related Pol polyprotein from transposon opus isoform X6 [Bactrocera dorsalis]
MKIKLVDPRKTVQRRPYRLSPNERELVRDKINELLQCKIIRPSCSPYASPANGTHRLCVDYRELNSNTVADRYPLPLISDQIARLYGAKYFTCLDMASGYYQIPMHEESVECTAFVTPDGQYDFLAMPFGLKNAPSIFQRTVMQTLGDLANTFVVVYMDDVMVAAATKSEALERLQITLECLTNAGFSFHIEKCSFLKSTVQYLGYKVSAGEIRSNSRKVTALTTLPPPQSVSALRQFIGLASYFRQIMKGFSCFMKPLYL